MTSQYKTTAPFPSALIARVQDLVPAYCRSYVVNHGETDADPVTATAHESEIGKVRFAIRIAKSEAATAHIGR